MIIDNEVSFVEALAELLIVHGYDPIVAYSGEMALDMLVTEVPQLIICDLMMEDMDGYEVLKAVRAMSSLESIPFLFLTGMTSEHHRREGMILGADDFLAKPFKIRDLCASVEVALARHRKRVETLAAVTRDLKTERRTLGRINFMTNHEVRASLSTILQVLEMARNGELKAAQAIDFLQQSATDLHQATLHINDALESDAGICRREKEEKLLRFEHVLLVDDDAVQTKLNELLLKKWSSIATLASRSDGCAALDYLSLHEPDVVFLDINMPGLSGIELLSIMRQRNLEVPVVMLSSSMDTRQINQCMGYKNVISYQVKPLNPAKVKELLVS